MLMKLTARVSNSNPLTGRISYQRWSAGRTLNEKCLCGLRILEEGSQGPNMTLFLHLYGFIYNTIGKNSKKSLLFNKNPHTY